jgi:hypothetical protein
MQTLQSRSGIATLVTLGVPSMQALELFASHPAAQTRVTRLVVAQALPAGAAVLLHNLRQLHLEQAVSVDTVRALQRLSCLTSLTVTGLKAQPPAMQPPETALQPADLPPRLLVFRVQALPLYALEKWMPVLVMVSVYHLLC